MKTFILSSFALLSAIAVTGCVHHHHEAGPHERRDRGYSRSERIDPRGGHHHYHGQRHHGERHRHHRRPDWR